MINTCHYPAFLFLHTHLTLLVVKRQFNRSRDTLNADSSLFQMTQTSLSRVGRIMPARNDVKVFYGLLWWLWLCNDHSVMEPNDSSIDPPPVLASLLLWSNRNLRHCELQMMTRCSDGAVVCRVNCALHEILPATVKFSITDQWLEIRQKGDTRMLGENTSSYIHSVIDVRRIWDN